MAYNTLSLAEKISTKAIQVGDCLIWQGQKDKRGYGFLRLDGRMFNRAWETRKDAKYQAFRLQLLGEPKRGRGRPSRTAIKPTSKTQGTPS